MPGRSGARSTTRGSAERSAGWSDAVRADGDLVVWVLHVRARFGHGLPILKLGHVRLLAELERRPDEPTIVKTSVSSVTTSRICSSCSCQRGIRELIVCGIRTDQCCETTTRVASDLGFDVTFVTDATHAPLRSYGLSAAEVIDRTERVAARRVRPDRHDRRNSVSLASAAAAIDRILTTVVFLLRPGALDALRRSRRRAPKAA